MPKLVPVSGPRLVPVDSSDADLANIDQLMAQSPAAPSPPGLADRMRSTQVPLPENKPGMRGAIGRGAATSLLDSLIGLGNLGVTAGSRILTGQPLIDREVNVPGVDAQTEKRLNQPSPLPKVGERVLPIPETVGLIPGARQARKQNPDAFRTGEVLGDIGTLITGRLPIARSLGKRSERLITDKQVSDALEALARADPKLVPRVSALIGSARFVDPGKKRLWTRIKDSDAVASVMRGAGKTLETGLEGAALGIIKEGDPVEMAAIGVGGQLATSMGGTLLGVPTSAKGLAVRAGTYTALFALGQRMLPGDNNIYEAMDSAFGKIRLGITVGAASQIVGGRFRGSGGITGRFAADVPIIADAINAIPRGAMLSVANRITREQEEQGSSPTLSLLETASNNPSALDRETARELDSALRSSDPDRELDRLLSNQ